MHYISSPAIGRIRDNVKQVASVRTSSQKSFAASHLAFTMPLSTTNLMFGSVTEVSATFVLTMTFR